jgi:hypothetical protein
MKVALCIDEKVERSDLYLKVLSGIRCLDFSQDATLRFYILGDFGAEEVKVKPLYSKAARIRRLDYFV